MVKFMKVIWLAAAGFLVLGEGSCFQTSPTATTPNPMVTPTETPPWAEFYGQFFTKDVARAQKETPFPIVLPGYVPRGPNGVPPPEISGVLREYQRDGKVDIDILYIVVPGEGNAGTIQITETNRRLTSAPPELNPDLVYTEVRGKRMVKTEGNFGPGPGVVYYFDRDQIYFVVRLYNLPAGEALKVVESMLE